MKKISLILVCVMLISGIQGCGGDANQSRVEQSKEVFVDAIGNDFGKKSIQNDTLKKTASDGLLSGSWGGCSESEYAPESIFSFGRSCIRGIEIDKFGRAHLFRYQITMLY